MAIPQRNHCLCIPHNEAAIEELYRGLENEENTTFIMLSDVENDSLFWVYEEINHALDVIIDECEEEYIYADAAPKALAIVKKWLGSSENAMQIQALKKLERALEHAIEYGTYLELSL